MVTVDKDKCTGCGICSRGCPLSAISVQSRKATTNENCSLCGACVRFCPEGALSMPDTWPTGGTRCDSCPIECWIKPGFKGACHRYQNIDGKLTRVDGLLTYEEVKDVVGPEISEEIKRPLITAIGAGTTYPDCKPSPVIAKGRRGDVDVVTVATEAPLLYSSVMVKIDSDSPIGEPGAVVRAGKSKVGMVITEQYGSKILSLGGASLLTGKHGLIVARTITDIANRKRVNLKVEKGPKLELQVGTPPMIDGKAAQKRIVGCGSATVGIFAAMLKEVADEVIILSYPPHTGVLSQHAAGRFLGMKPSGIRLRFPSSTPGRCLVDPGSGWGGTCVTSPLDLVEGVDPETAWVGMRFLVTEPKGEQAALFEVTEGYHLKEIAIDDRVRAAMKTISMSCEESLVSAVYVGGVGGSARAGAVTYPLKLTEAIHSGLANLTVGGAPTFVWPGGGINFMVDVEKVKVSSFFWTPTPAFICPVEYTMELRQYEEMGGHVEAMKPFSAFKTRKGQ